MVDSTSTTPELSVRADCGDGAWIVHVSGVLDAGTAPLLAGRLASLVRLGALDVIVDLCGLEAAEPAGLAVLTGVARRAEWSGIGFATIAPAGDLRDEIDGWGVQARLQMHGTEAEARAHAAATSRRRPRATALTGRELARR